MKVLICTNGTLRTTKIARLLSSKIGETDKVGWWHYMQKENNLMELRKNPEFHKLMEEVNFSVEVFIPFVPSSNNSGGYCKVLNYKLVDIPDDIEWRIEVDYDEYGQARETILEVGRVWS